MTEHGNSAIKMPLDEHVRPHERRIVPRQPHVGTKWKSGCHFWTPSANLMRANEFCTFVRLQAHSVILLRVCQTPV
jgi:hypothetical protein